MFGGFPVFLTRLRLSSWCGNFKYRGHEAKCCIWEWRNLGSNFSSAIIKLIKILCYILQQTVPSEPGCRVGLMWVLSGRQAANGSQPQLLLSVSQGAREHPEAQVIPQTDSIRTSAGGTRARSPHDYVCPPLRTSGCRIKAGGVSVKVCLCGWNEEGERSPVWYEVGKSTKWAPGEVWPAEAAGGEEPIRVLRGACEGRKMALAVLADSSLTLTWPNLDPLASFASTLLKLLFGNISWVYAFQSGQWRHC